MATALPAPCQSSPAWLLRYLTVQSALLNGSQPLRVVSFAPRANVGMGNRIVGLLEAAFTAAASDSLLALDYSNFGDGSESQYLRPNLIRWDASEWPAELRAQAQRQRQGAGKLRTAKQVTAAVSGQHKAVEMTTSGAMTLVPSLRGTASLQPALADRGLDAAGVDESTWRACAVRSLFRLSTPFAEELGLVGEELGRDGGGGAATPSFDVGVHIRSIYKKPSEHDQGPLGTVLESFAQAKKADGRASAQQLVACAVGMASTLNPTPSGARGRPWYVAADSEDIVRLFTAAAARVGRRVLSLPPRFSRSHSGLVPSSLAAASSNSTRRPTSSLAPLLDVYLLASAASLLGTAGSTLSEIALAVSGAHDLSSRPTHCNDSCALKPAILARGFFPHHRKGAPLPLSSEGSNSFCARLVGLHVARRARLRETAMAPLAGGRGKRRRAPLMLPPALLPPEQLPLVVTFFMQLDKTKVKHGYDLSTTTTIRAPYMAYCDDASCASILDARADASRWLQTTVDSGWNYERLLRNVSSTLGVGEEELLKATTRSAGDRLHCRSAELVLIWLAKPLLVSHAMAAFPTRDRFAWVDAGFKAYMGKGVPSAPWERFWPERGVAVRRHSRCCKPPHLRPARNSSCVEGTYLYGSRAGWERFIAAYRRRVRELVSSQENWGARGERLLCADQDIMTDVVEADPSLAQELLPPDSWKWHDIRAIKGDAGPTRVRHRRRFPLPRDANSTAGEMAVVRRARITSFGSVASSGASGGASLLIEDGSMQDNCASMPSADVAVFTFVAESTSGSLRSYTLGVEVLGTSVQRFLPGVPRYLMVHPSLTRHRARGWITCYTPPIRPLHETRVLRWRDTFTKLAIFGLTQFGRALFLDADTLVIGSLAQLVRWPMPDGVSVAAVQDYKLNRKANISYWSDEFNTGVMLVRPNATFFRALLDAMRHDGLAYNFGMGSDQQLLASFVGEAWARLPRTMNANLAIYFFDTPVWHAACGVDLEHSPCAVVHFTVAKPWACRLPRLRPVCEMWSRARRTLTVHAEHTSRRQLQSRSRPRGAARGLSSAATASLTASTPPTGEVKQPLPNASWCERVAAARRQVPAELRISVPCDGLAPTDVAVVAVLTEALQRSRISSTLGDYVRGAMALGGSLQLHLSPRVHRLLLLRSGLEITANERSRLAAVGWRLGIAPDIRLERDQMPRFPRFRNTFCKLAVQGLVEYAHVLLMDVDTIAVDSLDGLLLEGGRHLPRPAQTLAAVMDFHGGRWSTYNTGMLLWRTSAALVARLFSLLRNSTTRHQSDQTFLNGVYGKRSEAVSLLPFGCNAQTHVEVQLPQFWATHSTSLRVLHFTQRKGWECEEVHRPPIPLNLPPRHCGRLLGKSGRNLTVPSTDADCFCAESYRWWNAYRHAEGLARGEGRD